MKSVKVTNNLDSQEKIDKFTERLVRLLLEQANGERQVN